MLMHIRTKKKIKMEQHSNENTQMLINQIREINRKENENTQIFIDQIREINRKAKRTKFLRSRLDRWTGDAAMMIIVDLRLWQQISAFKIQIRRPQYNEEQAKKKASSQILYFLVNEAEENGWITENDAGFLETMISCI